MRHRAKQCNKQNKSLTSKRLEQMKIHCAESQNSVLVSSFLALKAEFEWITCLFPPRRLCTFCDQCSSYEIALKIDRCPWVNKIEKSKTILLTYFYGACYRWLLSPKDLNRIWNRILTLSQLSCWRPYSIVRNTL